MDFTRIRKPGLLFDGKRVQFRAQHDGRAGAVLENRDDSSAADSFGHFVSQRTQSGSEFGRGLYLMRREFGVLVQVHIEFVGRGIDGVDFFGSGDGLTVSRNSQRKEQKKFCFHGQRMIAAKGGHGKS